MRIATTGGSYPVILHEGGLEALGTALAGQVGPRRVAVVSGPTVGALYGAAARDALERAGFSPFSLALPGGEAKKDLDTWRGLVEGLLQAGVDRGTPVLALGGGVTGDIAGFAAATTLRGLPLVQVPTTLLAMVDSSVGGKTGVNTARGKNLVGAFYPPILVFAPLDALRTLSEAEYRSGLGELLKHAVLGDADLFAAMEAECAAILARDPAVLRRLLAAGLAVKAAVVAADEHERGVRILLNLGHTVGHALETAAGHGGLRHGEAVSLGLVAEARWAAGRGELPPSDLRRLEALTAALGLAQAPPSLSRSALLDAAAFDKKRASGMLRMPILRGIGRAEPGAISADDLPDLFADLPGLLEE